MDLEVLRMRPLIVAVGDALPSSGTFRSQDELLDTICPGWWRVLVQEPYATLRARVQAHLYGRAVELAHQAQLAALLEAAERVEQLTQEQQQVLLAPKDEPPLVERWNLDLPLWVVDQRDPDGNFYRVQGAQSIGWATKDAFLDSLRATGLLTMFAVTESDLRRWDGE